VGIAEDVARLAHLVAERLASLDALGAVRQDGAPLFDGDRVFPAKTHGKTML